MKVVQNKLIKFEKQKRKSYLIKDVNLQFKTEFENWNIEEKYSSNTILSNLKEIKAICYHARKKGLQINNEIDDIKTRYRKANSIYLNFDELEIIENLNLESTELENARDWLIISCYTAQRVSDFMRFTTDMISTQKGVKLIEFIQLKTNKLMTLPLHSKVLEILDIS